MKKIVCLILLLCCVVGFSACEQEEISSSVDSILAILGSQKQDGHGYQIAVISAPDSIEESSYNQSCYDGVLAFMESRDGVDTVTALTCDSVDQAETLAFVQNVINQYDIFILLGDLFTDIYSVASSYSNKYFILVDPAQINYSDTAVPANLCILNFKEEESGFLAGLAAALTSETGKVAAVTEMALDSYQNYQLGFAAGVNFSNRYYLTKVEIIQMDAYAGTDSAGNKIEGNYLGETDDADAAYTITKSLATLGADVIFVAAGTAGEGAYRAATEAGVKIIASDQEMDGIPGGASATALLTAVYKDTTDAIAWVLETIDEQAFPGGNYLLGAGEGMIHYFSPAEAGVLSKEDDEILAENYILLTEGTIIPPSVANGYEPTSFPGY